MSLMIEAEYAGLLWCKAISSVNVEFIVWWVLKWEKRLVQVDVIVTRHCTVLYMKISSCAHNAKCNNTVTHTELLLTCSIFGFPSNLI